MSHLTYFVLVLKAIFNQPIKRDFQTLLISRYVNTKYYLKQKLHAAPKTLKIKLDDPRQSLYYINCIPCNAEIKETICFIYLIQIYNFYFKLQRKIEKKSHNFRIFLFLTD